LRALAVEDADLPFTSSVARTHARGAPATSFCFRDPRVLPMSSTHRFAWNRARMPPLSVNSLTVLRPDMRPSRCQKHPSLRRSPHSAGSRFRIWTFGSKSCVRPRYRAKRDAVHRTQATSAMSSRGWKRTFSWL
jgi:hypothetical protein